MKILFVVTIALMTMAQQTTLPTEPQITGIMISANAESLENARLAEEKTKNDEVRMYALKAINEHKAGKRVAGELAERLKITPEENETTRAIKRSTQKTRFKLKRLTGAYLDRAYINGEVELNQMMLDLIDRSLLPAAQTPDLKWMLKNDRPLVKANLERAKELQLKLK